MPLQFQPKAIHHPPCLILLGYRSGRPVFILRHGLVRFNTAASLKAAADWTSYVTNTLLRGAKQLNEV
jgi:hypothetical protein